MTRWNATPPPTGPLPTPPTTGFGPSPWGSSTRRNSNGSPPTVADCPTCGRAILDAPDDRLTLLIREGEADASDDDAAAPPRDLEVPIALRDHPRYRPIRRLGGGGMGTVYLAEHRLMRRLVAVKVVRADLLRDPQLVERFRGELVNTGRLDHPNIVAALDADRVGPDALLVMEFVPGPTLHERLREEGPLPVVEACALARDIAQALGHAHDRGMIHRDVKTSNVMVTSQGRAKVLDFGLARRVGDVPEDSGLSRDDVLIGSADTMAPEQADDPRRIDIRADLYSLGCVLYEMLTGEPPFPADSVVRKLKAHATQPAPRPSSRRGDVPPGLDELVARLLEKEPTRRPSSPAEVVAALDRLVAPLAGRSPRRAWLAYVIGAGGLIAVGFAVRRAAATGELAVEGASDVVTLEVRREGEPPATIELEPGGRVELAVGDYGLKVIGPVRGLRLESRTITIRAGRRTIVRFEPTAVPATPAPAVHPRPSGRARIAFRLAGHSLPRIRLAVLGDTMASISTLPDDPRSNGEAIVWDLRARRELARLRPTTPLRPFLAVALQPGGSTVALAEHMGVVHLFDRESGIHRLGLDARSERTQAMAFTPDGRHLVTAGAAGNPWEWSVADGRAVLGYRGFPSHLCGVAISPRGDLVAATTGTYHQSPELAVKLWRRGRVEPSWTHPCRTGADDLVFTPDGRQVVSCDLAPEERFAVELIDAATGSRRSLLEPPTEQVRGLALGPDGRMIALALAPSVVQLRDLRTGATVDELRHDAAVHGVRFSPDGGTLYCGAGSEIVAWDLARSE